MKVDWHPGVISPALAGPNHGLVETDPDLFWQMGFREARTDSAREWAPGTRLGLGPCADDTEIAW